MEVLPGRQKGTYVYVYDDYLYSRDSRYDNVFRCSSRRTTKCPGSIIIQENNVDILMDHNHPKLPFIKAKIEMKEEMLKLSRETNTGLKEIFDSICRRNPDAGQYLSFASVRCSMHRERMKSRPSVPDTLASLYDVLENSDIMQNICKEKVITTDGKTAIILSTDYLLQALSSTTEIYVDGTFSVLPRKPHIAQLYSVHIRYMDTGIATLFILCDVRTTTLYDALWNKITQLAPQLEQNIKFIMSDFEIAAVKSLNKKFPRANLTGCWFHFNQAVLRKWRKLRLSNIPKTVLSMTMTLPLLPPDMFQEALFIIQTEADQLSGEHPNILQFISYLRLTWSNMASKISTYRCPVRTNNIVESFHNIAVQKLGTRNINIWTFLDKLSHLITDQELDLRRLNNGVRPRRLRTRTNKELDSKIINAQEDLVNKRLSLKEFLLMFTTNNNIFQMEQMASTEDADLTSDERIDMELFSDNLTETLQTRRQNINHRFRRIHRNIRSQRGIQNVSATSTDDDRENSSDIHTITFEQPQINATANSERQNSHCRYRRMPGNVLTSQRGVQNISATSTDDDREISLDTQTLTLEQPQINITADSGRQNINNRTRPIHRNLYNEREVQNVPTTSSDNNLDNDRENYPDVQIIFEQPQISISADSEDNFTETPDDELIYDVPEDDYSYLNDNSTEDIPFHTVNWNNLENNESTSQEKSSEDICTVCFVNVRTHAFTPCGHLACCFPCIERLEANRCPICNVIYENYIRIKKP